MHSHVLGIRNRTETSHASNDRVLVIDDHGDLRDTLCALIEQKGYSCRWAHSADEALRIARSWEPGLVILEPLLLDGSGRGLSHKLRELARASRRYLRIVAYSHHGECSDVIEDEDVDECLTKPGDPSLLAAAVRRYLPGVLN